MYNKFTGYTYPESQKYHDVTSDAYWLSDRLYSLKEAIQMYIFAEPWTEPEEVGEEDALVQEVASDALDYARSLGGELERIGWLVSDVVDDLVKRREGAYKRWKEESENMDQEELWTNKKIAIENAQAEGKQFWDEQVIPLYDALLDDVITWLDHFDNGVPSDGFDKLPRWQQQLVLDRNERMKYGEDDLTTRPSRTNSTSY